MNYRDFKATIALEANEPRDYEQIVFRTPDGIIYNNITVDFGYWNNSKDKAIIVNLFNIKPKFKVGDIVCNNSGLYPNVKCTIAEVNEELEYYGYKEVNGRTYFKDQDKLTLIEEIKANFKSGDIVINSMELNPKTELIIDTVNFEKEYYTFKNSPIQIKFKDQDKLTLVKYDEIQPLVEGEDKLDILAKAHADNVKINVLKYNIEHYPLIYNALKQIVAISKEGAISYNLIVPMKKETDEAGIYYVEDEVCGIIRWHFNKLDYKIEEKIKDNYNEFFITW